MSEHLIEGLHVDVKGTELKELLLGRLKYHNDKVSNYEKQLVELKRVDKALAEDAEQISKFSTQSPAQSLEQAIKKHKDQTIYYRFVADHIITAAVYRLGEHELQRLGIQSDRY
jgi:hypothetical protein